MIGDFNNGTAGWMDRNTLLDEKGGPNHVGNFCYALIITDTRNGQLQYTNFPLHQTFLKIYSSGSQAGDQSS